MTLEQHKFELHLQVEFFFTQYVLQYYMIYMDWIQGCGTLNTEGQSSRERVIFRQTLLEQLGLCSYLVPY